MPDLANVLKDEIRRLARKELKAPFATLKKTDLQQRRDIAALKRENGELKRRLAALEAAARRGRPSAASVDEEGPQVRFSAGWVAGHREKLGISQAEYARLVGVSAMTIHNWERGHTRPQGAQLAAWGAVRKLGKREAIRQLEQQG